ncbi:DNA repair protein rad50 [Tulasnella sp. 418]|nr:DNA repair protein rad50 [Tulasnella sp. 418]
MKGLGREAENVVFKSVITEKRSTQYITLNRTKRASVKSKGKGSVERESTLKMATLDALAIRGIRAFDPQKLERINFASPGVTVIVGHNGSGKTTIVECLKYATTGDQPPNTRGGAFVHDPKMAHEKEVKAQVKLRFYARNGVRMTATRNLMVTAKKTGLTMKTLESLLDTEGKEGSKKRTTISTKCAEIDVEIPNLLGVSKSVLDNVIFCHQEDSYWPLAEPSILKKKFDDIFEATKYTKALDNIKAIRKERVAELKVEKERLEGLANEKRLAQKLQDKINELSASIADTEMEITKLQDEESRIVAENVKFADQAAKFKEYYMRADELAKRLDTDRSDAKALEESLGREKMPPSVTDEELKSQIHNFENVRRLKSQEVERIKHQLENEKDNETALRRKLKTIETNRVTLEAEAKVHGDNVTEREAIIRTLAEAHSIQISVQSPLKEDDIDYFIRRLKGLQQRHVAETERSQEVLNSKNAEYANKIADLRSQVNSLHRERDNAQARISTLQTMIENAEGDIDKSKNIASLLKFNNDDLEDKNKRLQRINDMIAGAKFESKLSAVNKEIQKTEGEREALYTEQSRASLQANARAKLEVQKADLKKKKADVDRILTTQGDKFRALVDVDPQIETMETDVDGALSTKNRELVRLEAELGKANREHLEAQSTLNRSKKELTDKRAEVTSLTKKIEHAANLNLDEGADKLTLGEAIEDAKAELQNCQETAGRIQGVGDFFVKMLEDGKKNKKCGVCDRKLTGKDMDAFEETVKAKIEETRQEKIEENSLDLDNWTRELKRLQDFLPMEVNLNKIKKELPELEKSLDAMHDKEKVAQAVVDKVSAQVDKVKRDIGDLNSLLDQAKNVTRTADELKGLRKNVTELERELQSTGSSRTAADIQGELDALAQTLKNLGREKQSIIDQQAQQLKEQRSVEHDIHELEMKGKGLQQKEREVELLKEKVDEARKEIAEQRASIPEFANKAGKMQSLIVDIQSQQKEEEKDLKSKLNLAQEKLAFLNSSVQDVDSISNKITAYMKEDKAQKLLDAIKSAADMEANIQNAVALLESKRADFAAAQKEIDLGGAKFSNLRDNLRLRKLRRRIEETETELEAIPMEEAANSRRTFDLKWEAMSMKERNIKDKLAGLIGGVGADKARLGKDKKDMATDFKNIGKRYMDQLVKVKMSDMANNDLEKYAKALDNAIMKYHSLKMEEVNDTMRHLWNKTYQGTDIDGIMIRSEGEGGASKRSYNYRVVMMKDQVEMDMRGRCSAGQKMLASIIIRLALSDSFGQDCGILALDEPTNALDTENIEALAASLVEIINERKRAKNFQLIIITHDENFLRKLGENGVIQEYWRVTRNDKQKSVIEKHMLM